MRTLNATTVVVLALALASCSKADGDMGTDAGAHGGAGGFIGGCSGETFDCAYGANGICGDALAAALCMEGHWTCRVGQIPLSECRCAGLNPQACTCGDAGWICPDGGAGSGGAGGKGGGGGAGGGGAGGKGGGGGAGSGGAGGKGGGGGAGSGGAGGKGGGGGAGGSFACGNTTCPAGDVCVREQTLGGACFPVDAGCPAGSSPAGQCCVRDPSYSCVALPAACNGTLSCDCVSQALCTSGHTCAMPTASEIDCTLLAP
jgi:hypothetical protein